MSNDMERKLDALLGKFEGVEKRIEAIENQFKSPAPGIGETASPDLLAQMFCGPMMPGNDAGHDAGNDAACRPIYNLVGLVAVVVPLAICATFGGERRISLHIPLRSGASGIFWALARGDGTNDQTSCEYRPVHGISAN